MPCRLQIFCLLCFLANPAVSSLPEQSGPWTWSGVERVVVIPDVHGAYPELTELLKASGIVDPSLKWIAGETHLVSLGDLLDRGDESRKVMDLLIRLQGEALANGGRVHVVAGNHEIMNLVGDLRYVSAGEFAAFADMERAEQRNDAYRDFLAQRSEALALGFLGGGVDAARRNPKLQQAFEDLYPPGYFGHRSAFSPEGAYGRWLMSLPAMIVINRTVFVHGGLPEVAASAPIDELNGQYQADQRRFFTLWRELIDADILTQGSIQTNRTLARNALRIADTSSCHREERLACSRERGAATDKQRSPSPETLVSLKELIELEHSPLLGPKGPLWYRGSVRCKDILEMPVLLAALENLGADRIVVGHTPTTDRRVHRLRSNRLVMLDTGMLASRYQGRPAALIMGGDGLEVQYLKPIERAAPLGEGGNGVYPLSADELRQALESGEVTKFSKGWFGTPWDIDLEYQGVALKARFFPADEPGTHKREMAAYRLDEMLGFDLVPTTVVRQVSNQVGVLQLAFPNFLTESRRRREHGDIILPWCPLPPQLQLLEVYDLLIANAGRSGSSMGYAQPLWNLQASDHGDAFSVGQTLPGSSGKLKLELPASVTESLLLLDAASLSRAVGQALDEEQIAALLARRDAIVDIIGHRVESYDPAAQAARGGRRR